MAEELGNLPPEARAEAKEMEENKGMTEVQREIDEAKEEIGQLIEKIRENNVPDAEKYITRAQALAEMWGKNWAREDVNRKNLLDRDNHLGRAKHERDVVFTHYKFLDMLNKPESGKKLIDHYYNEAIKKGLNKL